MARVRIGDMLLQAGLIDEAELQQALDHQKRWGGRLGEALVQLGLVDELLLWKGLSRQLGLPLVHLDQLEIAPACTTLLGGELAMRHQVFCVQADDRELVLATSDPGNVEVQDTVARLAGRRIRLVLAVPREITWALGKYYQGLDEPCPAPRTKTHDEDAEDWKEFVSHRSSAQVESLQSAGEPSFFSDVRTRPGAAGDGSRDGGAALPRAQLGTIEQSLRQTTSVLRQLVDHCVDRGLFSRQEYLDRIKRLRSG